MKNICLFITLLVAFSSVSAQKIQELASKNIEEAIPMFEQISDFKNTDHVKLLGLGDVGEFVKESKKLNTAFSAYLITKKKFRNIVIQTDDWLLRPLNSYLTTSAPADTARIDSLIKNVFSGDHEFANPEFGSLMRWIKSYNLTHLEDMVNILGVTPHTQIPPSYFLATYVRPVDGSYMRKLSEKWSDNATPDSTAYSDIKIWLETFKDAKLSNFNQDLIFRCNEDLIHNKFVLKLESASQKFPVKAVNERSRYTADQILKKLSKKTIFYSLNLGVTKIDLQSNFVKDNLPSSSVGKFLSEDLKENYYVFITDFADTATLPVADLSAQKMNVEIFTGSTQAQTLFKKKDYFEHKKDKDVLKGYTPMVIPYVKGQYANALVKPETFAADAIFLFSHLSEIDLNY